MTIVFTQNSRYEVDTANKVIRRVSGTNSPTQSFGEDEVWRPYAHLSWLRDGLLIQWPNTTRATYTSPVVEIEGDSLDIDETHRAVKAAL